MYIGYKNIKNLATINELSLQLFHKSVNTIYTNIACQKSLDPAVSPSYLYYKTFRFAQK
jgi:hypothetical protein